VHEREIKYCEDSRFDLNLRLKKRYDFIDPFHGESSTRIGPEDHEQAATLTYSGSNDSHEGGQSKSVLHLRIKKFNYSYSSLGFQDCEPCARSEKMRKLDFGLSNQRTQ
jgi:hypothetical protein